MPRTRYLIGGDDLVHLESPKSQDNLRVTWCEHGALPNVIQYALNASDDLVPTQRRRVTCLQCVGMRARRRR